MRPLIILLATFLFHAKSNAIDLELLRYKVLENDTLGSVLNDLGICPLWGDLGHVAKVAKMNKNINPNGLKVNSEILIPYNFIYRLDKVIFLKNRFIIPKVKNQNLCDDFLR